MLHNTYIVLITLNSHVRDRVIGEVVMVKNMQNIFSGLEPFLMYVIILSART
jgi:hypothetical protein